MNRRMDRAQALDTEEGVKLRREFFAMMERVAQEPADLATPELWGQINSGSREGLPPSDGLALPCPQVAKAPTLKELLLAETPRAEIEVPPRRQWRRRPTS